MWPVITLTLLHQLTDEEQLYAQAPVEAPAVTFEAAPHNTDAAPALEVVVSEEQNG